MGANLRIIPLCLVAEMKHEDDNDDDLDDHELERVAMNDTIKKVL